MADWQQARISLIRKVRGPLLEQRSIQRPTSQRQNKICNRAFQILISRKTYLLSVDFIVGWLAYEARGPLRLECLLSALSSCWGGNCEEDAKKVNVRNY